MKQLDIYGNEVDLKELDSKPFEKQCCMITLKIWFRNFYGYRQGFYCKNCKFFESKTGREKICYKCTKMSTSSNKETDIRKNDIACNLYEAKS